MELNKEQFLAYIFDELRCDRPSKPMEIFIQLRLTNLTIFYIVGYIELFSNALNA